MRAEEYARTKDLPALRRYLAEAPGSEDQGEAAVNVVNALIDVADAAYESGDVQGAKRTATEAQDILAIALQLGVAGGRPRRPSSHSAARFLHRTV